VRVQADAHTIANGLYRYPSGWNLSNMVTRKYNVTSKNVVLPEGSTATNAVGLLFDRLSLGQEVPEIAQVLWGDVYATAFPDRCCVCLYSEQKWFELRSILERIPNTTNEQKKLRRIALGLEVKISHSEPFIVPVTLASYGRLSGDDVLVVKGPECMELWAMDSFD